MQIAIIPLTLRKPFRDTKRTTEKVCVTPVNKHMQNSKDSFRIALILVYIN